MPQAPAWAERYVGIPYVDFARDGDGALDCWGLLAKALDEQAGIKLPLFRNHGYQGKDKAATLAQFMDDHLREMAWTEIWKREAPGPMPCPQLIQAFDGIRLRMDGHPLHVALAVGNGWFLHTERGINSMLEEIEDPKWINRINGVYRWAAS